MNSGILATVHPPRPARNAAPIRAVPRQVTDGDPHVPEPSGAGTPVAPALRTQPVEEETNVTEILKRLVDDTQGQDLIEYGLLVGIVTVAAVAAIATIGSKVGVYFTDLNTNLP
jgi:pilus assembly protein Flp/PilA